MMNDFEHDELANLLRTHEPPLTVTPERVRTRAIGVRRRRRLAAAVGACAAAVAGVVVVPSIIGSLTPERGSQLADFRPSGDGFSADVLAAALRRDGMSRAPSTLPDADTRIVALDSQGNEISDADRDKASIWHATFTYATTNLVEIRLTHEDGHSLDEQKQHCSEEVDAKWSVVCEATRLADGTVIRSQTRGVTRQDGAWPVVTTDEFSKKGGNLWFQRMIRAYHPEGGLTAAVEFTKADSLAEAGASSMLTEDELIAIATNPDLRFPEPAPGRNGCAWTVPEQQGFYDCD